MTTKWHFWAGTFLLLVRVSLCYLAIIYVSTAGTLNGAIKRAAPVLQQHDAFRPDELLESMRIGLAFVG